jgi:hypothetical protein
LASDVVAGCWESRSSHPPSPGAPETRLFPCSVLASIGPSTGTRPPHHSAARTDMLLLIRRTVRPGGYASGPSLAAAWLDSLFEHPTGMCFFSIVPHVWNSEVLAC